MIVGSLKQTVIPEIICNCLIKAQLTCSPVAIHLKLETNKNSITGEITDNAINLLCVCVGYNCFDYAPCVKVGEAEQTKFHIYPQIPLCSPIKTFDQKYCIVFEKHASNRFVLMFPFKMEKSDI